MYVYYIVDICTVLSSWSCFYTLMIVVVSNLWAQIRFLLILFFYGITFLFPMVSTPETLLRPASAENFKRKKANENDKNNLQRM